MDPQMLHKNRVTSLYKLSERLFNIFTPCRTGRTGYPDTCNPAARAVTCDKSAHVDCYRAWRLRNGQRDSRCAPFIDGVAFHPGLCVELRVGKQPWRGGGPLSWGWLVLGVGRLCKLAHVLGDAHVGQLDLGLLQGGQLCGGVQGGKHVQQLLGEPCSVPGYPLLEPPLRLQLGSQGRSTAQNVPSGSHRSNLPFVARGPLMPGIWENSLIVSAPASTPG